MSCSRIMIDLYEPSMSERGLRIKLQSGGPLIIEADAALIHRMIANLFDNELKHLPAACTVNIPAQRPRTIQRSLTLEDDGPGFDPEVCLISSSEGSRERSRMAMG